MEKSVHDNELYVTKKRLKRQEVINVGLLIALIMALFIGVKNINRERTIVTPPVVRNTFWVDSAKASADYLQQMSTYFVQLVNNISPSNIDYQNSLFVKFVLPTMQDVLKSQLDDQSFRVKRDGLSTMFYIGGFKIDQATNKVVVRGQLNSIIGDKVVSSVQKSYRLSYQLIDGKLYINGYGEVNNDNPWGDYVNAKK